MTEPRESPYELVGGNPMPRHLDPSECDLHVYLYRYMCSAEVADPVVGTVALAAAEIQDSVYGEGWGVGNFQVIEVADGVVHFVIERPDCESDYHVCYVPDGHDGSDQGAITQLQAEFNEILNSDTVGPDALIRDVQVHSRTTIDVETETHLGLHTQVTDGVARREEQP